MMCRPKNFEPVVPYNFLWDPLGLICRGRQLLLTAAADQQARRKKGSNFIRPETTIDDTSATNTVNPEHYKL